MKVKESESNKENTAVRTGKDRRQGPRRSDDEIKVVRFTKIKQWYLPVSAEDYNTLMEYNIAATRIHRTFMPTLDMLNSPIKRIQTELVDFNEEILNPYLDRLGAAWQKKEHRKALLKPSTLTFESNHPSLLAESKLNFDKIQVTLERFFQRWGYDYSFEYSEKRGKSKLHVKYKFETNKMPIISLVEDPTSLPVLALELGFLRITFTLGAREVETNVAVLAGSEWRSMHTSRCLYSQISDVRPMMRGLMGMVNKNPESLDVKAKK